MSQIKKCDRLLVTGGTGLIGKNLVTFFANQGYEVIGIGSKYDLRDITTCQNVFEKYRPTKLFHLAARVGGIYANSMYKADFYSDNVLINTNVVNTAVKFGLDYIFAMGTGCAYPKRLENSVLFEKDFLDGTPEQTNDAYAYAKRGLLVHLQSLKEQNLIDYTYCLPSNIYGPFDNFHPMHSHVIPALLRRFYEHTKNNNPSITVWGDGSAKRDFLYIDDCVQAIYLLANNKFPGVVNVASSKLTSIKTLAENIRTQTGYDGSIRWDTNYPTGQTQRIMNIDKISSLGWKPQIALHQGILKTLQWIGDNSNALAER